MSFIIGGDYNIIMFRIDKSHAYATTDKEAEGLRFFNGCEKHKDL